MTIIQIKAGSYLFKGKLEQELAPKTCAKFMELLPYQQKVIHSRWSGEAVWIPLGDLDLGLDFENHSSHPSRGDILLYPGVTVKPSFCLPMAVRASPVSRVNSLATTSLH